MSIQANIRFVLKVMAIHTLTYILKGIIFLNLCDYDALFNLDGVQSYMKGLDSYVIALGPIFQIVRGVLLGAVLLPLRSVILNSKFGWFYLWSLLVVVGIISPYGAAPSSIEGVLYTNLPLEFHLKMLPEVVLQTLLFSILLTGKIKLKIPEREKKPIIATIIAWIGVSVSGIILAISKGINISDVATDIGAHIVLIFSLFLLYFLSKIYFMRKLNIYIYYLGCYLLLALLPIVYNYLTDSLLLSPLSLVFAMLPVFIIWLYDSYIS